jgi:hypothetical protein
MYVNISVKLLSENFRKFKYFFVRGGRGLISSNTGIIDDLKASGRKRLQHYQSTVTILMTIDRV